MKKYLVYSYLDDNFNSNKDVNSVIDSFCGDINLSVKQQNKKDFYYIYVVRIRFLNGWCNSTILNSHGYYCRYCNLYLSKGVRYHVNSKKHTKRMKRENTQDMIIDKEYILKEVNNRWVIDVSYIDIEPFSLDN